MKLRFEIEKFPFDEGFLPQGMDRQIKRLPFILESHSESSSRLRQMLDPGARELLRAYYEKGGYASTPLGNGEYALRQGREVFQVIDSSMRDAGKRWADSDVLEIGSSYGYLLHCAKEAGAKSVLGVEPGDEGNIGSQKYGIPYLQDFFPSDKLDSEFDVICTHCVLEHIEEIEPFVAAMIERLKPGGLLFAAVPDCEGKLGIGDISIVSHQHVNYFTSESFRELLEDAGLGRVTVASSAERSILYAWGVKADADNTAAVRVREHSEIETGFDLLALFALAYRRNIGTLQRIIRETRKAGGSIGFYGISPVLCGLLTDFGFAPRLFDGDAAKHGTFIAGCDSPVESPERLIANPVDKLLVCPVDYDREIRVWLGKSGFSADRVISLLELFEHSSGRNYHRSR